MGNYIVRSNIEDIFGVENVAVWSNLENDDAQTNDLRVTRSISYAEGYVNDRLRGGRYQIPLSGNSQDALTVVKDICAKLAGLWLYESRGTISDEALTAKMEVHERKIEEKLDAYLSGSMKLDCVLNFSGPTTPVVVGEGYGRSRSNHDVCYGNGPLAPMIVGPTYVSVDQ